MWIWGFLIATGRLLYGYRAFLYGYMVFLYGYWGLYS